MSGVETGNVQVMVVDDISSTRAIVKDMLRELGFTRIVEAGSGREALEALRRESAHLIVCDHSMRDMNGLELLIELQGDPQLCAIPFIVMSATSDATIMNSVMQAGAADYIVKPVAIQTLFRKVTNVLRKTAAENE
jgi:two-component system chemotaxis response regulator CheY